MEQILSSPPVRARQIFSKVAPEFAPAEDTQAPAISSPAWGRGEEKANRLHSMFHDYSFAPAGEEQEREREINKMVVVPPPPEWDRTRKVELIANDRDTRRETPRQGMAMRLGAAM